MKTYYKINEISKLYNIGQDSLRYYEELGILHPMRDKNNYRQYTTSDIHRLNVIRDLRNLGFSMKSIQDYLENRTIANSLSFMEEEERIINQKIQELYQLKVDILHRKASLKACQQLQMETIELMRLPQRKCVALTTDAVHDDVDYQLMKLSKEYEKIFIRLRILIPDSFWMYLIVNIFTLPLFLLRGNPCRTGNSHCLLEPI